MFQISNHSEEAGGIIMDECWWAAREKILKLMVLCDASVQDKVKKSRCFALTR